MARRKILELTDWCIDFRHPSGSLVQAVKHVDLELKEGEWLGITGQSGCGKTTLIESVGGLLTAIPGIRDGRLALFGEEVVGPGFWRQRRSTGHIQRQFRKLLGPHVASSVGVMFQNPHIHLHPLWTVEKQLRSSLSPTGALPEDDARLIDETVEKIRVDSDSDRDSVDPCRQFLERPTSRLSGGQAQRVMLGMTLMKLRRSENRPFLLLADEPTTRLDPRKKMDVLEKLKELKGQEHGCPAGNGNPPGEGPARKVSAMLVTHDLDVIRALADRVLVMYSGYIVEELGISALARALQGTEEVHPYTGTLMQARGYGGEGKIHAPPPDSVSCPYRDLCLRQSAVPCATDTWRDWHTWGPGHRARCPLGGEAPA